MYCVRCGVKLADTEKSCPLCGTVVYHPDVQQGEAVPMYPTEKGHPPQRKRSFLLQYIVTFLFLLPAVLVVECDLQLNRTVTWSGYVVGGLVLAYIAGALPLWFRKPHPVCFVPGFFAAVLVYLHYIDVSVHGGWFLTFAFPEVGGLALIVTAVTVLLCCLRRGRLYIFGGACILLGGLTVLMEYLLHITFHTARMIGWSMYPCTALGLIGAVLIFLAICEPARETMERKLFL
jgi:hypothetical protein